MTDAPAFPGGRFVRRARDAERPMSPPPWVSFEIAGHRVIVRTVAGGASYVAGQIDRAGLSGVLGTIAGNDSVAMICTEPAVAERVVAMLTPMFTTSPQGAEEPDGVGP